MTKFTIIEKNMSLNHKVYPLNPLGIIATFVFFIEAIGASTVFIVKDNFCILNRIINFIIIFPSSIAFLFFIILIFKRQILFGPGDFQDENNFLHLIDSRLKSLELGQKVSQATANPPTNLDSVFNLVDELIEQKEFKSVVRIGRGYLKLNEFSKSKRFFEYVRLKTPKTEDFYYTIISNIAYSKTGLGEYEPALAALNEVKAIIGEQKLEVWHLAAFTYVLYKLGRKADMDIYLEKCRKHSNYENERDVFKNIYKDCPVIWE